MFQMASPSQSRSVVVVSPYRAGYGPARVLEHVCQAISAAGFDPVCIVPALDCADSDVRTITPRVYEARSLGTIPRTLNPLRLTAFLHRHTAAAAQIERIAKEVDAVAIHTVSEAVFAGSLAGRRLGIPTLVHVIGMSIQSPTWAAHLYIRFLNRLADRFVACSGAVRNMLVAHGVETGAITVVHNGVGIAEVNEAFPAESGAGPRVGMVAAFDPRKGHDRFVEAAAVMHAQFPDAQFVIVGGALHEQPGSVRFAETLRARIAELGLEGCFHLVGQVPRPEAYRWIKAMDVVVVPSRTEAFAHVLIEAMAAGKPVVATAVEGNLDAFVDRHSGIYVDGEPDALAAAVCELLADPELGARIGSAAHDRVQMLFSVESIVGQMADAIRDLVTPPSVTGPLPLGSRSLPAGFSARY